jgi:hypothetical protein
VAAATVTVVLLLVVMVLMAETSGDGSLISARNPKKSGVREDSLLARKGRDQVLQSQCRLRKFTSHLRHMQEALDGNSFAFK